MAITGPDKDTPMKVGPGIGDLMPATMCAVGIVSAILRAHKTGRGQFVDVGMVDAILSSYSLGQEVPVGVRRAASIEPHLVTVEDLLPSYPPPP